MNEYLKQLITPASILSYSQACIDVCGTLLTLKGENFKRLVIPSRGAYPFYLGALTSLHFLTTSFTDIQRFNNHFNVWLLPYTADWGQAHISASTQSIRKFWTKILADTIRREQGPFVEFYRRLVEIAGTRLTINTTDLLLDKFYKQDRENDEKFIFIDTAVSGQAICEVIKSFSSFNLKDYYIILIVDQAGKKLKSQYKNIIERERQAGKLMQIDVDCIYSEDASPLLNTGISSIVFPSLIERAYHELPDFNTGHLVGAGLWFIDSTSHLREGSPQLNGVRGILGTLNYRGMRLRLGYEDRWFDDYVSFNVEKIIEWLGDFNTTDPNSTKKLIYDRIASRDSRLEESVDVSGSHVIRIDLPDEVMTRIIKG